MFDLKPAPVTGKPSLNLFHNHRRVLFQPTVRNFKPHRSREMNQQREMGLKDQILNFPQMFIGGANSRALPGNSYTGLGRAGSRMDTAPHPSLEDLMQKESDPRVQSQFLQAYKLGLTETYEHLQNESRMAKRMETFRSLIRLVIAGAVIFAIFKMTNITSSITKGGLGNLMDSTWVNSIQSSDKRFADVVGCDEAKQELTDVVDFLANPDKFKDIGARLPRGVLLVGEPGVGKTLLAKAVAGEAQVPFYSVSGSEFDEMFVGVGAKRVRELFEEAKRNAPCIIFIDEMDAVAGKRTTSPLHPYANQTVNQMLNEMDGFETKDAVIVIGATNLLDNLDKALLRPGRFDFTVQVHLPDRKGRTELLQHYLSSVEHGLTAQQVGHVADVTTGNSGADIENLVNQGAIMAALAGADRLEMVHMNEALDKVNIGTKRPPIMLEHVNRNTAAHEAGHTIVSLFTPGTSALHKVTILPRGQTLGVTYSRPSEEQQYGQTRGQLLARMDVCMGGYLGEELFMGGEEHTTGGVSNDFQQATMIAERMVKLFGMSDKIGPRSVANQPGNNSFIAEDKLSQKLKEQVDAEVDRLLKESMQRARDIMKLHMKEHKLLTEALLKYETLDAEDVHRVIKGEKPLRPAAAEPNSGAARLGSKLSSLLTSSVPKQGRQD